ncbi:hypothetical protein [Streptomyces sp. NPDC101234]|uniref:hypothetical protein n=1 Tax=Streptomyces sp. NPDC101234 TaxID=3366138 RepID=UPI0038205870
MARTTRPASGFVDGFQGGLLRLSDFRDDRIKARKDAGGTTDAHFHDLPHTGNTLAVSGASLPELMTGMGHSTPRAVLIRKERGDADS